MSKYTTEVRYICENKAGLYESGGATQIDNILELSWDKIFTTQCEFFSEEYRKILCKKILKHYYFREIGAETVGLWLTWVNRKLEEIMPYYNQMYSSALLEFNPMYDVDITTTHMGGNSLTENGSRTGSGSNGNTNLNLYSDTPQGAVTNLENQTYLTNARKVTDAGTYSDTETNGRTANSTDQFTEKVMGKRNGTSYSKMLLEFRQTFVNIDMQVIDEFADCFLNLW